MKEGRRKERKKAIKKERGTKEGTIEEEEKLGRGCSV